MRAADSPLRVATLPWHHAAEAHVVGKAMVDGTMPDEWWADWLAALEMIHYALDPALSDVLHRADRLTEDVTAMIARGVSPVAPKRAWALAQDLHAGQFIEGAAYVFTGAHLMGGAVAERALRSRLPCAHLRWEDRPAALSAWQPYRSDDTKAEDATEVFKAIIDILEEIRARNPDLAPK